MSYFPHFKGPFDSIEYLHNGGLLGHRLTWVVAKGSEPNALWIPKQVFSHQLHSHHICTYSKGNEVSEFPHIVAAHNYCTHLLYIVLGGKYKVHSIYHWSERPIYQYGFANLCKMHVNLLLYGKTNRIFYVPIYLNLKKFKLFNLPKRSIHEINCRNLRRLHINLLSSWVDICIFYVVFPFYGSSLIFFQAI